MSEKPLYERFRQAIAGKSYAEIEVATGMSRDKLRRLGNGTTKSLDVVDAVRLARFVGQSVYYLAGEPEPAPLPLSRNELVAIGTRIEKRRERLGWNIDDLASQSNMPSQRIVAIEDGMAYNPKFLVAIAEALGVDVVFLTSDHDETKPPNVVAETERPSDAALLASGGLALTEELADLRARLEQLEAASGVAPQAPRKRAAR